MREGSRHHPGASAPRLVRECLGAEPGAINSRQLSAGFADYPANARKGVADNPASDRGEPYRLGREVRRYRGAPPARSATRASCCGECVR
jgi:hypothetical protein